MSITLRLGLLLGAAVIFALVCYQVARKHIRVADSVFWVVFSVVLLLIAIFPQIAFGLARLVGIASPSNFVFAVSIGILIIIDIQSSSKISMLTDKLQNLASKVAMLEDERREGEGQGERPSSPVPRRACSASEVTGVRAPVPSPPHQGS